MAAGFRNPSKLVDIFCIKKSLIGLMGKNYQYIYRILLAKLAKILIPAEIQENCLKKQLGNELNSIVFLTLIPMGKERKMLTITSNFVRSELQLESALLLKSSWTFSRECFVMLILIYYTMF